MSPIQDELQQDLGRLYADRAGPDCGFELELSASVEGRLDAAGREALQRHLAACPTCRAVAELLPTLEPVWDEAGPSPAPLGFARLLRWLSWPRLAAAAAAALVLTIALVWTATPIRPDAGDRLVPKGAFRLHVAAEVDGRTFRLQDGDRLPTGARLGFFYSTDRAGYLMILYADESGQIVRLVPAEQTRAASVEPGHQLRLPDGAVLSPGRGCEWVVALFSTASLSNQEAAAAVARMLQRRHGCRLSAEAAGLPGVSIQTVQVQR